MELLLIVALSVSATLISLYAIRKIRKRRLSHQQVKTGFLGKPLLQFIAVFFVLGAIFSALYLIDKEKQLQIEADKEITIEIDYTLERENQDVYRLELSALPIIDSKEWGDTHEGIDIFWEVNSLDTGESIREIREPSRSSSNPSNVNLSLESGRYQVEIMFEYDGEVYQESKSITVE